MVASYADVLKGSSCVPAPRTSAEKKDKFLSHCSQISAEDHTEIQSALLKSKWHIRTSSVECDTWPKIFVLDENLGDKPVGFLYISICKGWLRCHLLIKLFFGRCNGGVTLSMNKRQNFFHTSLFCSKSDYRSANLTSEVIFFKDIVRIGSSTNACELTE